MLLSAYDIIGFIADIQTSFTENFKILDEKYEWKIPDARLLVLLNCAEVAANARMGVGLLEFAKANGLDSKDWWDKWTCYDSHRSFARWPDFKVFVDDKSRQFIHRLREHLLITIQMNTESFLRNLARQFDQDHKEFWKLKKGLLEGVLRLSSHELMPLAVYQHLRNCLHNKGLHYNNNYPNLEFEINEFVFLFSHGEEVKISWEHIRELQVETSRMLMKIIEHPKVTSLPPFKEETIVLIIDGED